ncbi:MAG TPA: CDP-diacylglycerol--serine O-phosphatidyltransferase [bacterium]|nr:CDP-diacylglycerol--serine O-phosphatidyltransferase [bacterium]HPN43627.1 CDP-diacylglycerol--serine O-phosphatidyltransferase [bacterium]
MKNDKYITVPNLFTTINLFCGYLAVVLAISGHFINAAWLIFVASIFDALDGKIARASGISSQFGLQIDSLSDLIASGMAPSILLYQVHLYNLGITGIFIAFLPLLFAAFRLARYNVLVAKSGRSNKYDGLPAPMGAVTIASVVILYMATNWHFLLRMLIIIVPVVSLLMASTIKYEGVPRFSLREKGANRYKLLAMFVTIILMFIIPEYVLPLFMLIYLLSGLVLYAREQLFNHIKEKAIDTN